MSDAHGRARSGQTRNRYPGPNWRREDHRTLWSSLAFCRLIAGDHPGLGSPLTTSQIGLYWLLFEYLLQSRSLVRWDPNQLARTLEIAPETWHRDWAAIAPLFDIVGGILTHPVIEFEIWRTLTGQFNNSLRPDLSWRTRLAPRDRDQSRSRFSKRESQSKNILGSEVLGSKVLGSKQEADHPHAHEAIGEGEADQRWRVLALPVLKESLDSDTYDGLFRDSVSTDIDGQTLYVVMADARSAQNARRYTSLAARSAGVRHVEFTGPDTLTEPSDVPSASGTAR